MHPTRITLFSLLFGALPVPDGRLLAQSPTARFEQRYEELRTRSRIPAISVAIAQGQRIVWARSFGVADRETGRRATDTTVYHLASITKPIASTVILQRIIAKLGLRHTAPNPQSPSFTAAGTSREAFDANFARG